MGFVTYPAAALTWREFAKPREIDNADCQTSFLNFFVFIIESMILQSVFGLRNILLRKHAKRYMEMCCGVPSIKLVF